MGAYIKWTPKSGGRKLLLFDGVVTDETQTMSSASTDSPVEDGPDVTDHIRPEAARCSLQIFISNQPIVDVNSRGGTLTKVELSPPKFVAPLEPTPGSLYNAANHAIRRTIARLTSGNQQVFAQVLQFPEDFDAVEETQRTLETLRDTKQLVNVVLSTREYESMLIEKVSISRDAGTGDGAKFSLDMKQIRVVQASIVAAPIPTETRGEPMKKKGTQATKDAKTPEKKKSILKGLINRVKK